MDVPSMAVGGVAPTLSPLLLTFLVMAFAGGFLLVAALLVRNARLVGKHRLNPLAPTDLQQAANPDFSTRAPGTLPFRKTPYGRSALGLLALGVTGTVVMLLIALFSS